MTPPKTTLWKIEPHTKAKHEILKHYLGAWFGIMSPSNKKIIYLDGFCGPGKYLDREDGSPIIALNTALNHFRKDKFNEIDFIFIEEREDRFQYLEKEIKPISTPSNIKIYTYQNKFEETFRNILDDLDKQENKIVPAFAFLDPFGFKGVSYSIIKRLLSNDKTEVFINFMADSINRFTNHEDNEIKQHILDLFGSSEVFELNDRTSFEHGIKEKRLLYQKQLQKIAKFVRFFEMSDKNGRIIYDLFFASNNRLGHIKMKEAFWKLDCSGGCRFSDATNPDQMVLFNHDPSESLSEEIYKKYSKHTIPVEQIRIQLEDETVYLEKHLKSALKILEKKTRINAKEIKLDGNKRRKNSFPDNAVVIFN